MSRARNIKPGFFKNDILAECSPLARILFVGLWCEADREGRLEDRVKRIKADCLPYDDCDVSALLDELNVRGFIVRYEANGSHYIAIPEFAKHQNPHCKEQASTIPAPCKPGASPVHEQDKPDESTEVARLIPDSPSLIPDSPKPQRADARSAKSRGTRLPSQWRPDAELIAWAKAERADIILPTEIAKFSDYWTAKPGQQGVKLDWSATFRNWIRSVREGPPRAGGKPPIAQNFSAKTYTGTPDDELPAYLRANQA